MKIYLTKIVIMGFLFSEFLSSSALFVKHTEMDYKKDYNFKKWFRNTYCVVEGKKNNNN